MTIMNFPSSPNLGDEYVFNNITYIWDDVKWVAQKSNEQNMNQLLDSHKQGVDQHSIDGVKGLREELDLIKAIKSTCLVNAIGTGAPHETVVSQLPANIAINGRYVLPNPFGNNTPVICLAEVFANGKWSRTGFAYTELSGYGTEASYVQGEGIVVQTGGNAVLARSSSTGSGHGIDTSVVSAPCRVFVRKLEA